MSDLDPEVIDTTQTLLDAVTEVLGEDSELMPTSAILIYKTITRDGGTRTDYVITHDLDMADVIGLSTVVKDDARQWFLKQRNDDV